MLKAYMMHAGEPIDGAALVFAESFRQAKVLAFNQSCVCDGCEYTDIRGHRIGRDAWLKERAADQKKLAAGEPHVIDSPPSCKGCELWFDELEESGYCETCAEEREDAA
ncbi:hypothetical protein [Marinobacter subterrani]|uniref:Uncharacterized protein n=1 Tax=Marinobacter subterrani TaxID=1658765 RepID=A0A0J7JBR7_9GAMM|nr:hypothetical protein [Marinobacter subterrani]KMQ75256.1 hypothetical protein Msub_11457 [Marinobacter subterrani]